MKIGLISAKGVGMGDPAENDRTAQLYGSLTDIGSLRELMSCPNSPLLAIGAFAEKYFDVIKYIDEEYEKLDPDEHFDLVALSFMTQQASRAYEIGDHFRRRNIPVIAGGMHPSNFAEQTKEHFDAVFIGEAETTWPEFMKDFARKEVKPFYRNKDVIDLRTVPMPRFDLLHMDYYRTIPIQISRGCPHDCEFCASTKIYGPKFRYKAVEQVLSEVEAVKRCRQHPYIYFTDDNMLVVRKYSKELLRALAPAGIRWITHTDVSVADDDEILELAQRAGCKRLVIGFESINGTSLKDLEAWKFNRLDRYAAAIEKIQGHGIGVWGTFIVGLDGDDTSIFQRTVDFALQNNLYGAMISVPTPFPGSRLYEKLKQEGRILTEHWGNYTLWNVVCKPKNMTVEQLNEGFAWTLQKIYAPEAAASRKNHFKRIFRRLDG